MLRIGKGMGFPGEPGRTDGFRILLRTSLHLTVAQKASPKPFGAAEDQRELGGRDAMR